jgi:hypothetical protein
MLYHINKISKARRAQGMDQWHISAGGADIARFRRKDIVLRHI